MPTELSATQDIAEDYRQSLMNADFLLREICQAGRNPTFADMTFFLRECGWDEQKVAAQLRRMNSVLRLSAIAGTAGDREASFKESESAAAVLEKEGPKLAAKIADLQAKLTALERDARLSAKRVEEQNEAVTKLRELVPEHVRTEVQSTTNLLKRTTGAEISNAETRVQELACCLDSTRYRHQQDYLESLQRSFRDAVTVTTVGKFLKCELSPAWPEIQTSIKTELTELQSKLETMRGEYDEALSAAELPLDYYTNQEVALHVTNINSNRNQRLWRSRLGNS